MVSIGKCLLNSPPPFCWVGLITFVLLLLFQPSSGAQFDASGCGQSKKCVLGGCTRESDPQSCHYLFSVYPDSERPAETVQMELFTKRDSPEVRYIAVGFSEDNLMGDDSVTYCVLNGDERVEAHLSQNPAADKTNLAGPPGVEEGVLELLEGTATEEGIYCKVRQRSNPSPQKDLMRPNLQRPFHLLFAKGSAAEPRVIGIHSLDPSRPEQFPFVHAQPLLLLDPRTVPTRGGGNGQNGNGAGGGGGLSLVDVHGMLMAIAWLGLTMVAIYSARYMRNGWPHTTVMGLKIWFHIHRTLNFLSVLIMVASVVFIVLNKQRWTGPWFGRDKPVGLAGWHSLAGAVAVFFALGQPIGALLRCGVDHPKRPIFNWLHRSAGLLALFLAQIAMFIAVYKFKKHFALADFALWLLIFFYAALLVLIVASEVLRLLEIREQEKSTAIEMQTRSRGSTPSDAYYYHTRKSHDSKLASLRKTMFTVAVSLCGGTALLLVLLILFQ